MNKSVLCTAIIFIVPTAITCTVQYINCAARGSKALIGKGDVITCASLMTMVSVDTTWSSVI